VQAGHRSVPHTADSRIEAWAPTFEECVAEAVTAMVETFADVSKARPTDTASFELAEDTDVDTLVDVLDEVIYLMDTADVIPLATRVERRREGHEAGYEVVFDVCGLDQVEVIGAVPKAVCFHGRRLDETPEGWTCSVTLDV